MQKTHHLYYGPTLGSRCESPGADYVEPGWVSDFRREANSAGDCIVRAAPRAPPDVQTRNLRLFHVLAMALNVYENAAARVLLDTFLHDAAQDIRPVAIVFESALFPSMGESG